MKVESPQQGLNTSRPVTALQVLGGVYGQTGGDKILHPSLASRVTSDKLFNFSVPHFPHSRNEIIAIPTSRG